MTAPGNVVTSLTYNGVPAVGISWSGPVAGEVSLTLDAGNRLSDEMVDGADLIEYARDAAGYQVGADDLTFVVGQEGLPTSSSMGVVDTTWTYDADDGRPRPSPARTPTSSTGSPTSTIL